MGNSNTKGKTLYIIGNGFDLDHKIKSSYADFKEWCIVHNIKSQIEYLFGPDANWSNIEEALGNYQVDDIYEKIDPYDGVYKDEDPFEVSDKIDDSVKVLFKETTESLKSAFTDWVNIIDINNCFRIEDYKFISDNFYLTFNYTETLERIYNIPSTQICHIHGSRLVKGDDYVFGHNNKRDVIVHNEDKMFDWEVDARKAIIKLMNDFEKSYNLCGDLLDDFLKGKKIDKVMVYGHSLGKVDWPYFEKIIEIIGDDIPWEVNCYDSKDKVRMQQFKQNFGLKNIKAI